MTARSGIALADELQIAGAIGASGRKSCKIAEINANRPPLSVVPLQMNLDLDLALARQQNKDFNSARSVGSAA